VLWFGQSIDRMRGAQSGMSNLACLNRVQSVQAVPPAPLGRAVRGGEDIEEELFVEFGALLACGGGE
jgi:hypothetical protein